MYIMDRMDPLVADSKFISSLMAGYAEAQILHKALAIQQDLHKYIDTILKRQSLDHTLKSIVSVQKYLDFYEIEDKQEVI